MLSDKFDKHGNMRWRPVEKKELIEILNLKPETLEDQLLQERASKDLVYILRGETNERVVKLAGDYIGHYKVAQERIDGINKVIRAKVADEVAERAIIRTAQRALVDSIRKDTGVWYPSDLESVLKRIR
jgi:hypothetical protein